MDASGLARWSYMTFSRKEGHLTTILAGYNPCHTTSSHTASSYQLQQAYLTMAKSETTCPRRKFEHDLISLLTDWRSQGRRLIVCLDANDHVYDSRLGKALVSTPNLDLQEAVSRFTGTQLTATHFRGTRPIDAI